MRFRFLPIPLLLTTILPFATLARAEKSAVTIRVEQNVVSEMGKVVPFTRKQHRGLTVFVSNTSSGELTLKVKHIIFGRETDGHKIVAVGQGENPVTVKPLATEEVDIPVATTAAIEAHYDVKKKAKIPASGSTIVGNGVQVLQGDKVVAESYDPPSLKEDWAKVARTLPAVKTPAKPAAKAPAATKATPAKK